MGRTTLLSTYNTQVTYVNPIILRIIFPTNSRPSSGNGFYISLSYDAKYFGDSVVMIIYNDVCYSCNASTLECINTSACQDVSQISKVTQNPKKPDTDGENTSLPLIISLCVVFVLIIGTITVLILLKRRHTGQFSPWCVDTKKLRHLPNHPPAQSYDTINFDNKKSTSQIYETLKPPVVGRSNVAFDS